MSVRLFSALLLAAGLAASTAAEVRLAPDPVGPDHPIECDWSPADDAELGRRFGGFYTNFWTDGIVPYTFEAGSITPVRADTLSDVSFTTSGVGPRLTSPSGFSRRFAVGDVLRVDGSQNNDGFDMVIVDRFSTGGDPNVPNVLDVQVGAGFTAESPDGSDVVFFTTESVSELNRQRFQAATQIWEAEANVQFVPWTGQPNWVRVKNADRNRVDGAGMSSGENLLLMDAWHNELTIAHELAHELGAKHEHQRPDRDTYVTINMENVLPDRTGNFDLDETMDVYPPTIYDFSSIMHYFDTAFLHPDSTGVTIEVDPPYDVEWQDRIGRYTDLSFWDRKTMSFMYPEPGWRFLDGTSSAGSENGAFRTPYRVFADAINGVPSGGRIIGSIPATYVAPGVYDKNVVIEAPLGGVVIRGN